MSTSITSEYLSRFLTELSNALDISDSNYENARASYRSLGDWLSREEAKVSAHSPEVYSQGSFRLGTVIKPTSDTDEYDVDVVCELDLSTSDISQNELKDMVGNDIKAYAKAQAMNEPAEEGRRCWTLNYADGAQFHMDILPAVGDEENFALMLQTRGVSADWTDYAIAITDREHPSYDIIDRSWLRSNPRGYAEWFQQQMMVQFERQRQTFAQSRKMEVEDVPEYKIKTPLQRVVQLLKRHRDIMFEDDQEDKPISIIITTLAAHAYSNEADLLEALDNITANMPSFIEKRDGVTWIANPVYPLENFADKWEEHPQRERKFKMWLRQVRNDFANALEASSLNDVAKSLEPRLGERSVRDAISSFEDKWPRRGAIETYTTNRFDVPHRESPSWPGTPRPIIKISARYKKGNTKEYFESDGTPLPKHADLYFTASDPGLTGPFRVFWQVINTGEEARRANGLRGSIFPSRTAGRGGLKQKEKTLYTGSHAILCYIVQDGVCVARSQEFIVNIG